MVFLDPDFLKDAEISANRDSENRMIVASFFSTQHRNVTERRRDSGTDGGTDRAMATTALALQAMPTDALSKQHKIETAVTSVNHTTTMQLLYTDSCD